MDKWKYSLPEAAIAVLERVRSTQRISAGVEKCKEGRAPGAIELCNLLTQGCGILKLGAGTPTPGVNRTKLEAMMKTLTEQWEIAFAVLKKKDEPSSIENFAKKYGGITAGVAAWDLHNLPYWKSADTEKDVQRIVSVNQSFAANQQVLRYMTPVMTWSTAEQQGEVQKLLDAYDNIEPTAKSLPTMISLLMFADVFVKGGPSLLKDLEGWNAS